MEIKWYEQSKILDFLRKHKKVRIERANNNMIISVEVIEEE